MLYREQVRVPALWWVLAVLLAASVLLAFGFYLGPAWGLGTGLGAMAVAVAVFLSAGVRIEVDETEIRIGRAVIGRDYLAAVTPLDVTAARRRSGVDADARAHLVLRPWVQTAVELTLADPADPVPYWLVCTRRPAALARALQPGDRPAGEPVRPRSG